MSEQSVAGLGSRVTPLVVATLFLTAGTVSLAFHGGG